MKFNITNFVKPWISGLEEYIPGKTLKGYIKLASNENNYGPTLRVVRAIEDNRLLVHIYPHMYELIQKKVAGYCGFTHEYAIIGNGSDEILDMILKVFKGPALGLYPSFAGYKLFTKILGENYLEVNLNKDFSFPADEFIKKSKDANILFLCSPNNPTGTVISENEVIQILNEGKITIVDETYYEFYGKTIVPLILEYNNLIVLRTFSKAFALAGLRVGYAISNPEIIQLLHKVKPPFNVSSMAQMAGVGALDDEYATKMIISKILKDREKMYREISRKFKVFKPTANFLFLDVSPMKSAEFCDKLFKEKIIVRNIGKLNGFDGEYVRISVGTEEENRELLRVLASF